MPDCIKLIKESEKHIYSKSYFSFYVLFFIWLQLFSVSLNLWDGKQWTVDKPHKLKTGHSLIQYVHFYYIFVLPVL
jgi:hypothetical protein